MLITAGVDAANVQQAAELSLEQVRRIQLGEFSDELLDSAKRLWTQEVETVFDTNSGTALKTIHDWALNRPLSVRDAIDQVQQVTKKDVMEAAKSLTLDTVFAFSPKEVVWNK
jgi:predicted Zn-dependent peptidase